ncbi:MAG: MerR family transcriptional regulator [Actinomycetota bacterium]|nr:MerR family transcriptional regulator [Actinomycetota bacterium]
MTAQDAGQRAAGRSAIGAVLKRLQPEFPDLTISKIRYLESEGLVCPERRESGLRRFAEEDVERLRFVLSAQRDRYWPLRVIKDALDRMDRGMQPDRPAVVPEDSERGAPAPTALPTPAQLRRRRSVRLSPRELREQTGLDVTTYGALKAFGLLTVDAAGRHGADDLDVSRQCAALASFGLEARHLRLFRVAADRQIGLAQQILEPVRRRRARGAEGADPEKLQAEILAHSLALNVALVRAGLERAR